MEKINFDKWKKILLKNCLSNVICGSITICSILLIITAYVTLSVYYSYSAILNEKISYDKYLTIIFDTTINDFWFFTFIRCFIIFSWTLFASGLLGTFISSLLLIYNDSFFKKNYNESLIKLEIVSMFFGFCTSFILDKKIKNILKKEPQKINNNQENKDALSAETNKLNDKNLIPINESINNTNNLDYDIEIDELEIQTIKSKLDNIQKLLDENIISQNEYFDLKEKIILDN